VLGWQRSTLCAEAHLRLCGQHVGRSLELGAGRDDRRQARVERYGGGRERGWLTELLRHARADHESAAQLSLRVCPQLELHRLRAAQPGFGCVRVCVTSQPSPQLSSSRFRRLLLLLSLRPILAASCTPRVFQRRPPARLPDRQKPLPEGNHGVRSTRPGDADQHSYTRARRVGIIGNNVKPLRQARGNACLACTARLVRLRLRLCERCQLMSGCVQLLFVAELEPCLGLRQGSWSRPICEESPIGPAAPPYQQCLVVQQPAATPTNGHRAVAQMPIVGRARDRPST
jgi:hypothetical protein